MLGINIDYKQEIQALRYEYGAVVSRIASFALQVADYLEYKTNQQEIEEIADQTVKDYITYLQAQSGKE